MPGTDVDDEVDFDITNDHRSHTYLNGSALTGTTTFGELDYPATTFPTTQGLTFQTTSASALACTSYPNPDIEAFLTEWKKLRLEFLPILLRDDVYYQIKRMMQTRTMNAETKETEMFLIHYQKSFL